MYRLYARIASGIICLTMLIGTGCVAVPYQEFKTYDQAFTETKTATEKLLLEYDMVLGSSKQRYITHHKNDCVVTVQNLSVASLFLKCSCNEEKEHLFQNKEKGLNSAGFRKFLKAKICVP